VNITAIIPSRLSSSRFPGKPLADIHGLPMVEHVRRRVLLNSKVKRSVVATCDANIYDVVKSFGGDVMMTDSSHFSCNDRVAEVAPHFKDDIIVNVQGDEPLIAPEMLDLVTQPFLDDNAIRCSSLMAKILTEDERNDLNEVKVVCDLMQNAMYFSRLPIPGINKSKIIDFQHFKHIGIYAYYSDVISGFSKWGPSASEKCESIDILRFIENGIKVKMVETSYVSLGVDTKNDLQKVKDLMLKDKYFGNY
jgi:3-deoxy-manno-octulosonate cytidylyltransferase (CMP-KDO synthetase)